MAFSVGREVSDDISNRVTLQIAGFADDTDSIAAIVRRLEADPPDRVPGPRLLPGKRAITCTFDTSSMSRVSVLGLPGQPEGMENLAGGEDLDELLGWASAAVAAGDMPEQAPEPGT